MWDAIIALCLHWSFHLWQEVIKSFWWDQLPQFTKHILNHYCTFFCSVLRDSTLMAQPIWLAYDHSTSSASHSLQRYDSCALSLANMLALFCDVSPLQWPGRAASFESQGSCPSPKPPLTPSCSQAEWWHCRRRKNLRLFRVAGKLRQVFSEHVVLKFIPSLFLSVCFQTVLSVLQVLYRAAYAQHSPSFSFHTRAFTSSENALFDRHTRTAGLGAKTPRCFTLNSLSEPRFSVGFQSQRFALKWHKAKGLHCCATKTDKKQSKNQVFCEKKNAGNRVFTRAG